MKDDRVYLQHMLTAAKGVQSRCAGTDKSGFAANEDLQIIVVHLLQTIGEAARHVSESTRQKIPELPWKQITGMRHRIVHDYFNVDIEIVWQTVVDDLSPLFLAIESYLNQAKL